MATMLQECGPELLILGPLGPPLFCASTSVMEVLFPMALRQGRQTGCDTQVFSVVESFSWGSLPGKAISTSSLGVFQKPIIFFFFCNDVCGGKMVSDGGKLLFFCN